MLRVFYRDSIIDHMECQWNGKYLKVFKNGENEERKNGKYFRWMSLVEQWFYSVAKLHCLSEISYNLLFSSLQALDLAFAITFNFLFADKSIVRPQFACKMQSTITLPSQLDIEVHL